MEISFYPNNLLSLQIYRLTDKPARQAYRKFVKQINNDTDKNHTYPIVCWLATAMQLFSIQFTYN